MDRLIGKRIIVTGGNGAIGKAIVSRCIEEGAHVAIIDQAGSEENNDEKTTFIGNVSDENFIRECLTTLKSSWGSIDGIVNNAGIMEGMSIEEQTEENWEKHLDVNVKGMMLTAKHGFPLMKLKGGSIVNCSSIMAFTSSPVSVAYTVSKSAINGLTRATAMDGAPYQIRANSVCPGTIDTPMYRKYLESHPNPEELHQRFQKMFPLGKIGSPTDVANICVFLLSEEAKWITGGDFTVDGGYMIKGTNE